MLPAGQLADLTRPRTQRKVRLTAFLQLAGCKMSTGRELHRRSQQHDYCRITLVHRLRRES